MPSPFPGMDPYLESADIWPDFHDAFAAGMRSELNRILPDSYYARLEMRPEIGIVGDERPRRIVPDVSIVKPRTNAGASNTAGIAVLDQPRVNVSASVWLELPNDPLAHHFIEIHDAARGHSLVTLIEIASPANKSSGIDRQAYEKKQTEILKSDTTLIEIDFLRTGQPLIGCPGMMESAKGWDTRPDYLVAINRAWQRGAALKYQFFPVQVTEELPCIPIPLRRDDTEMQLDLQYVFQQTYDGGPYTRGAVDYFLPPDPPLRPELADWLANCLKTWQVR